MAVKITPEMHKTFIDNGFSENDIQGTVNHYRDNGMADEDIFKNIDNKYKEFAYGVKPFEVSAQDAEQQRQAIEGKAPEISGQGDLASVALMGALPSVTPFKGAGLLKDLGNKVVTGGLWGGVQSGLNIAEGKPAQLLENVGGMALGNVALGALARPFMKPIAQGAEKVLSQEAPIGLKGLRKQKVENINPVDLANKLSNEIDPYWNMADNISNTTGGKIFDAIKNNVENNKPFPTAQELRISPEQHSKILSEISNILPIKKMAIEAEEYAKLPEQVKVNYEPVANVAPAEKTLTGEVTQEALPQTVESISQPKIPTTAKQTKLSESIQNAEGLPQDIKETLKANATTYESMTNEDLIVSASDAIDKDLMGNLADVMAKEKFSAYDVERTRQIAKRLNAQNTPEANDTLINLLDKASEQASKSGQAVQAFSLWNNLTPEGAILKTNKLIKEYNTRFNKKLKLTPEQANTIKQLQEKAQALPEGYERDFALAQSLKYQQSLIPKSFGTKLKAYRNIALLLNPKTLGRNIVGNALFNSVDTASKALAVPIDKIISTATKTRTRAYPQIGESIKGLKLGAERGFREAMEGVNTADVSSRFDLNGGKVFESPVGKTLETALDLGLRVPDRAFYNSAYSESLANQLKASGVKEPTQKMLDTAEKEALEAVFQNKSKLSDVALGLRQQFNRVGTKEFGLGDLLIPYAQTPANLAQQGINYSPLGLVKAGMSLKGGDQRQASLDIARALVGTGIGVTGYNMAKEGTATGSLETGKGFQQDLRLKKNLELLGIRPQQIGDISYAPFQPMSIPFAVGTASATGENPLQAGVNTLLDLPFLQNYNKILGDIKQDGIAQAGINFVASTPSQFVPTALSQVNQLADNTARETYSPNKLQQGFNVAGAKIPFVAQTLPEQFDVTGQSKQRYETQGAARVGDVFLNPTFINKKKNDPVIKEMKSLYEATEEIAPLLPVAQRTVKINGEYRKLTGKEVSTYQKDMGKIGYYLRKRALESDNYKNLSPDEKVDYLQNINKSVNQAVKMTLFDEAPSKYARYTQEILDNYDTFNQ